MTYRNEVANLDGSQSYDPDNTGELTFSWDITSKPDGSNAVFSLTEEVAKFTPDLPGEYTIALTVNDRSNG
ncbi:PKD domain-containing protein [Vibrio crassostreae]|uniref:PKD domain-containing protein n=1 Tax=Vibrio crassostreae TaxID=246167 RepID=UPI00104FB598|nr:PKD domain-containing protein [Vibrio crassostreae]TCN66897.1 PKD domain-containing protein [Vibrio crassostreae]